MSRLVLCMSTGVPWILTCPLGLSLSTNVPCTCHDSQVDLYFTESRPSDHLTVKVECLYPSYLSWGLRGSIRRNV